MSLMRKYVSLWWENARVKRSYRDSALHSMQERRAAYHMASYFSTWRTLFRATLVARLDLIGYFDLTILKFNFGHYK